MKQITLFSNALTVRPRHCYCRMHAIFRAQYFVRDAVSICPDGGSDKKWTVAFGERDFERHTSEIVEM